MKRINMLLFAAILLIPGVVCAQSIEFVIKGRVGMLSAPAKAYLIYHIPGNNVKFKRDSIVIQNGSFAFKGTIPEPINAQIMINPLGNGMFNSHQMKIFFLEAGTIRITGPDSLANARIVAGPINAGYEKLEAMSAGIKEKFAALNKKYDRSVSENQLSREREASIQILQQEAKAITRAFIKENPESPFSLVELKEYAGANPVYDTAIFLFNMLSAKVKSSPEGRAYQHFLEDVNTRLIGSIAPDFAQPDTSGKLVSLHDFRGKYVLVDFWASWCAPCRAENPNIVNTYKKYKDRNFTILSVSLDMPGGKEKWLKAIRDDQLSWTHVSDLQGWKNQAANLYVVKAVPQNYLISPDGKIIAKNIRGEELQRTLDEFIK